MTTQWRVVVQIDIPGRRECFRFEKVPIIDPVHIAIVSDSTTIGLDNARALFDALITSIRDLCPQGEIPSACTGPTGLACVARNQPRCQSVLVAVGDGTTSFPQSQLLIDWIALRKRRSLVLPIMPQGSQPKSVLPASLSTIQTLLFTGPISAAVPDILRAAQIGIDEFRLFISYRRGDSQALADQLYVALARSGFRTYLDRFHGNVGRSFATQIAEELINAGCVLVLESPNVMKSPWTLAEVAFSRLYRLGLLALKMPNSVQLPGINARDRLALPTKWNLGTQPTLVPAAEEEVVTFVRSAYARQMLRRRVYLENTLNQALYRAGLTATRGEGGIALVDSVAKAGRPTRRYGVLSTRRPAVARHLRRVLLDQSPIDSRIVVGPSGLLPPESREDTAWIAQKLGIKLESEWNLRSLATRLANGVL